jgi:hypothetical protein
MLLSNREVREIGPQVDLQVRHELAQPPHLRFESRTERLFEVWPERLLVRLRRCSSRPLDLVRNVVIGDAQEAQGALVLPDRIPPTLLELEDEDAVLVVELTKPSSSGLPPGVFVSWWSTPDRKRSTGSRRRTRSFASGAARWSNRGVQTSRMYRGVHSPAIWPAERGKSL